MIISATNIPEVKLIDFTRHQDMRGAFVKTFHSSSFKEHGIDFELKESFYSVSHKNVIRGMHFHHEPFAHAKIVFCTSGSILDVALDLRKDSATFGKYVSQELSAHNHLGLYIPVGFAHGFLSLQDNSTTVYFVDGEYNQAADDGIMYNSFGFEWPVEQPIINTRDAQFKTLQQL
jgi:dTDP-4-dehydrorhamnose 3,5-epimerase